jgi:hypothetical protein
MSPAAIFQLQLVLGYVPWLLCFSTYFDLKNPLGLIVLDRLLPLLALRVRIPRGNPGALSGKPDYHQLL